MSIILYREIKVNLKQRCVELKKGDDDYDEHSNQTNIHN